MTTYRHYEEHHKAPPLRVGAAYQLLGTLRSCDQLGSSRRQGVCWDRKGRLISDRKYEFADGCDDLSD